MGEAEVDEADQHIFNVEAEDKAEKITLNELVCISESLFVFIIKEENSQTFKMMELEIVYEENLWKNKVP